MQERRFVVFCSSFPDPTCSSLDLFYQLHISFDFVDARKKYDGVRLIIRQNATESIERIYEALRTVGYFATFLRSQGREKYDPRGHSLLDIVLEQEFTVSLDGCHLTLGPLPHTPIRDSDQYLTVYDGVHLFEPDDACLSIRLLLEIPEDAESADWDYLPPCLDENVYNIRLVPLDRSSRPLSIPPIPPDVLETILAYAFDELLQRKHTAWPSQLLSYALVQRQWCAIVVQIFWSWIRRREYFPCPHPRSRLHVLTDMVTNLVLRDEVNEQLDTFDMTFTPSRIAGPQLLVFSEAFIALAKNLRGLSLSAEMFGKSMDSLRWRRNMQQLELTGRPKVRTAPVPSFDDILECINGWRELRTLAINLGHLKDSYRTEQLLPPGNAAAYRLERLDLSCGSILDGQLRRLVSNMSPHRLRSLCLYEVYGLTNDDMWCLFETCHKTLETLEVEDCTFIDRPASVHQKEHALDAFISSMGRLRTARVVGTMISSLTVVRKIKPTASGNFNSRLTILGDYDDVFGQEIIFFTALGRCGWDELTLRCSPPNALMAQEAERVAREAGVALQWEPPDRDIW